MKLKIQSPQLMKTYSVVPAKPSNVCDPKAADRFLLTSTPLKNL